jgi:hypothetical protein
MKTNGLMSEFGIEQNLQFSIDLLAVPARYSILARRTNNGRTAGTSSLSLQKPKSMFTEHTA